MRPPPWAAEGGRKFFGVVSNIFTVKIGLPPTGGGQIPRAGNAAGTNSVAIFFAE